MNCPECKAKARCVDIYESFDLIDGILSETDNKVCLCGCGNKFEIVWQAWPCW